MASHPPPGARTGVACPDCDDGELTARRSRRGHDFYGCSRYPRCTFTVSGKPVAEDCPECGSIFLVERHGRLRCPNEGCTYVKRAEAAGQS